jgi:hypothetical protein
MAARGWAGGEGDIYIQRDRVAAVAFNCGRLENTRSLPEVESFERNDLLVCSKRVLGSETFYSRIN